MAFSIFIEFVTIATINFRTFHQLQKKSRPLSPSPCLPIWASALHTCSFPSVSTVPTFWNYPTRGHSPRMMFPRSTHVFAHIANSIPSCGGTRFQIHSLAAERWDVSTFWLTRKFCCEHLCASFCRDACFISPGCIPARGKPGSCGISIFDLFKNCLIVSK